MAIYFNRLPQFNTNTCAIKMTNGLENRHKKIWNHRHLIGYIMFAMTQRAINVRPSALRTTRRLYPRNENSPLWIDS